MPFPNFYPPLFFWCVALLQHTRLLTFGASFKLMVFLPMLLAPAAILLAVVIGYPILRLIYTSFLDLSLTSGMPARFAGLTNFRAMIDDPVFWQATGNTILITLITVPGALVVGLALALLANLPFRMRWQIRLSLLIPWALPLSFAGLIFAWFFHSEYGVVNDVLRRFGVPGVICRIIPGCGMLPLGRISSSVMSNTSMPCGRLGAPL